MRGAVLFTVLCFAVFLLATTPATAVEVGEVVDIDDGHELAEQQAVEKFREEGLVSTELPDVAANLTVAERGKDVGLDTGMSVDLRSEYIRVKHREEVSQAVRFYLPSDYFNPYAKDPVETEEGNARASFEIVEKNGERYTSVTVVFDGEATATISTTFLRKKTFGRASRLDRLLEGATGYSVTSKSDQWHYIGSSALAGDESFYEIDKPPEEISIQYDVGEEKTVWLNAPRRDANYEIYYYSPEGKNTTHIVSMTDDSPEVRWINESNSINSAEGIWNDISRVPSRFKRETGIDVPTWSEIKPDIDLPFTAVLGVRV